MQFVRSAYAQVITNPVLPTDIGGKGTVGGEAAIGKIISAAIGIFLVFAAIAAFIFLLIGGLRWITSAGDKNKLQQAQDQISQAIIGLLIIVAAWAIMILVSQFTGIAVFGPEAGVFTLPSLEEVPAGPPTGPGPF